MIRLASVALGFTVALSSLPIQVVHAQSASAEAAINQRAADYIAAWNASDVDRIMAVFTPAKGWFVNGSTVIPLTDSLRSYLNTTLAARTGHQFKWDRTNVTMLGDAAALFQGVYGGTVSYKDGRTLEYKANAALSMLFERRGREWKITAIHHSAGAGVPVAK